MPKCGGTSFVKALNGFLSLKKDYHPEDRNSSKYQDYISNPLDLSKFKTCDCLVGHYNIPGIKLWERYPNIKDFNPLIFTILRDPLSTAISGIRFGIQSGWIKNEDDQDTKDRLFISRANYFSNVFGVKHKDEIKFLKKFLWKSCDVNDSNILLKDIYKSLSLTSNNKDIYLLPRKLEIPKMNITSQTFKYNPSIEKKEEFIEKAELDYEIYRTLTKVT